MKNKRSLKLDAQEYILEQEKKNKIVVLTSEGLEAIDINQFISQPIDGLLYDLNRGKETILAFLDEDNKWINDYAVNLVITRLKEFYDKHKK